MRSPQEGLKCSLNIAYIINPNILQINAYPDLSIDCIKKFYSVERNHGYATPS